MAEFQAQTANAVVALAEADRTVIVLRFYEGLTTAQMAEYLRLEPVAVRQRISRAVRRLRAALDGGDRDRTWGVAAAALARQSAHQGGGLGVGALLVSATAVGLLLLGWWMLPGPQHSTTVAHQAPPAGDSRDPGPRSSARDLVRFVDPVTKLPVAGVRWVILSTGGNDTGRIDVAFVGENPNPTPIASGTTLEDGMASYPPVDATWLHVATLRDDRYAASSWPVQGAATSNGATDLELDPGQRVVGRVVDDLGTAVPGAVIVGRDYYDELVQLGVTDDDGAFSVERIAPFPRAFSSHGHGEPVAQRVDGHRIWAAPAAHWRDVHSTPSVGQRAEIPSQMTAGTHTLPELVLDRTFRVTGRVVDEEGAAVAGALVSTRQARGQEGRKEPLPWAPRGALALGETLTQSDGTFELEARGIQEGLTVIARTGAAVSGSLPRVPPGGLHAGVSVTLDNKPPVHLVLSDPTQPEGRLRTFRSPAHQARVVPDLTVGGPESSPSEHVFTVESSGELTIPRRAWGRPTEGATLLVDGYAPVPLRLADLEGPEPTAIELAPRPRTRVTLKAPPEALPVTQAPRFRVAATSGLWVSNESAPVWMNRWRVGAGAPHLEFAEDVEIGKPFELPRVPGRELWLHVLPVGEPWSDGHEYQKQGPFDPYSESIEIDAPLPGSMLSASERQNRRYLEDVGKGERFTIRLKVVDAETLAPIWGASLSLPSIADRAAGRSLNDGTLLGYASPEANVSGFTVHKDGMAPHRVPVQEFTRGGEADFGVIALKRLRRLPVRVVQSSGTMPLVPWQITYQDGSQTRRQVTDADGRVVLELSGENPNQFGVGPPGRSRTLNTKVNLTIPENGGSGRCVAPDLQLVEVEVLGLDATWRLAPTYIVARHANGGTARLFHAGVRGAATVFRAKLPDGEWTLEKGPSIRRLQSYQLSFEVDRSRAPLVLKAQGQQR